MTHQTRSDSKNIGLTVIVLCLSICLTVEFARAGELKSFCEQAMRLGTYAEPTQKEVEAATVLFQPLFRGAEITPSLKKGFNTIKFRIKEIKDNGVRYRVVYESPGHHRGSGIFIFLETPPRRAALMAPHGFFDLYTGDIGLHMFMSGAYAGFARNTLPRYLDTDHKIPDQDLARQSISFINSFAAAFMKTSPTGWVIQLHGFSAARRKTPAGKAAVIILSQGHQHPQPVLSNLAACLSGWAGGTVAIYPATVSELGGTLNPTGRMLRQMGHDRFLHVEMNYPLRKKLKNTPKESGDLTRCMVQLLK